MGNENGPFCISERPGVLRLAALTVRQTSRPNVERPLSLRWSFHRIRGPCSARVGSGIYSWAASDRPAHPDDTADASLSKGYLTLCSQRRVYTFRVERQASLGFDKEDLRMYLTLLRHFQLDRSKKTCKTASSLPRHLHPLDVHPEKTSNFAEHSVLRPSIPHDNRACRTLRNVA